MMGEIAFTTDWERLDEGTPEERACFAALGIRWGNTWLTEGRDSFVDVIRKAPFLSAYHLAEWMAWNWWRLRWEPRSHAADWAFAHRLTTIGEGYVWPNITIFSDGERIALLARPTTGHPDAPFRYINDVAVVVPARVFEVATDDFIERVRGKLQADGIEKTNLDAVWGDIRAERDDPETARQRKLEALLGFDADMADPDILDRLVADARVLGEAAINELAAERTRGGQLPSETALRETAARDGFDASPRDSVRLAAKTKLPRRGDAPGWLAGAEAARALRDQQGLNGHPISDELLADMAGVQVAALQDRRIGGLAYALDKNSGSGKVVFRSKWSTGRRFELARLLGDRLIGATGAGQLFPATRTYTYRQKVQRSFAAELLSPFENIDAMLDGDYSEESQQDVADHFQVSDLTIRTLLANHRRIDREDLAEEFGLPAA